MHAPFAPPRRVERLRRSFERGGLILQREQRRLEDGHQPDLQRLARRVARAVVPQADRLVVDLLGGRDGRAGTAAVALLRAAAARGQDERKRDHQDEDARSGLRHHWGSPPSERSQQPIPESESRYRFSRELLPGDMARGT